MMAVFMAIVVVVGVYEVCVDGEVDRARSRPALSTCVGELEHESTRGFR